MASSSWGVAPACDGNGKHCFKSGQIKQTMCQVCNWEGWPVKTTQTAKLCVPCLIIGAKASGRPAHNVRAIVVEHMRTNKGSIESNQT